MENIKDLNTLKMLIDNNVTIYKHQHIKMNYVDLLSMSFSDIILMVRKKELYYNAYE